MAESHASIADVANGFALQCGSPVSELDADGEALLCNSSTDTEPGFSSRNTGHWRGGLLTKIWMQSQPTPSARPTALEIPPWQETWEPNSMEYLGFEVVRFAAVYSFLQSHRHRAGAAFYRSLRSSIDSPFMPVVMHLADCKQVCGWTFAAQSRNRTPS